MKMFRLALLTLVAGVSSAWAVPSTAQKLALAAFKSPTVPFQARLILTEWRDADSRAEEVRLFFMPPNSYRLEFLNFDGSVKKVVLTDEKYARVKVPSLDKPTLTNGLLPSPNLLTSQQIEDLLVTNYSFELKGSEIFIGRPVWILHLVPRTAGKPLHELRIDQDTLVVLEQRRYVAKDKLGSLTRFSSFEPNKTFAADVFAMEGEKDGVFQAKNDVGVQGEAQDASSPPATFQRLPAGFSLNGYRTFEVEGTKANHFTYTDGAVPLSVFETKLPVRFPGKTSLPGKSDGAVVVPTNGLSSADQVVYGKKGTHYFTIIGEMSPDLLHTIANHLN